MSMGSTPSHKVDPDRPFQALLHRVLPAAGPHTNNCYLALRMARQGKGLLNAW